MYRATKGIDLHALQIWVGRLGGVGVGGISCSKSVCTDRIVCFFVGGRRWREFGLEVVESVLTCTNVAEKIKVII